MKMTFSYRCEGLLGVVELDGSKYFDDAMNAWKTILSNIQRDQLKAVLLIDRSVSFLSSTQVLEIQQWMEAEKFPKQLKVAIIDEKMANKKNNNVFGETVVYNRGWANLKVFGNETSARNWLGLTE